jgi:hypothetical protein
VKTHGDLTGIAKMCSVMCGGGLDPTVDWKVIRPRHMALALEYHRMLLDSVGRGPVEFARTAERLARWRQDYDADIRAKFAKAQAQNDKMISRAMAGFQTARAVRITALGTLALLSGVGGVVGGGGTIAAFGVETGMAGLTFTQGLLFGVTSKAAYNGATSWVAKKEDIVAIVVSNGLKDAAQPVQQEAAQLGLEFGFYEQLRKWSRELNLGKETQAKIDELKRRAANQAAKKTVNQKALQRLEKQIANQTAEQAKRARPQARAAVGTKVLGSLPVVWLVQDLWGVCSEANDDMKLLH